MVFDHTNNLHTHSFEKIAASTAVDDKSWLMPMTINTFASMTERKATDISSPNGSADFYLYTAPQFDLQDETSAFAIGYTIVDNRLGKDHEGESPILRVLITHLAWRKEHAHKCMDSFIERIEKDSRLEAGIRKVGSGVLTITIGNFPSDIFEDREYARLPTTPGFSTAYQLKFTAQPSPDGETTA